MSIRLKFLYLVTMLLILVGCSNFVFQLTEKSFISYPHLYFSISGVLVVFAFFKSNKNLMYSLLAFYIPQTFSFYTSTLVLEFHPGLSFFYRSIHRNGEASDFNAEIIGGYGINVLAFVMLLVVLKEMWQTKHNKSLKQDS